METPYATPFHNIALSLSGGGYRAAAFSLGVLSYLNQLNWSEGKSLLDQVKILSTISGGTLTGVKFALYRAKTTGNPADFRQFFQEMYHFLAEADLLGDAMALLKGRSDWENPPRPQKLIKAFAEVYHRKLYGKAHFSDLWDGGPFQIPEIIFNATDLEHTGLFRFQSQGDFGNKKSELPMPDARTIRLADAAAASSCFPGGFEPLIMPDDFGASSNGSLQALWSGGRLKLRLMDGGIADNQGITSVLLAEERISGRNGHQPFIGTFIQADVATEAPPAPPDLGSGREGWRWLTLRTINRVVLLLILGLVLVAWQFPLVWVVCIITPIVTLGVSWLLLYRRLVKWIVDTLKKTVGQDTPAFLKHLDVLEQAPLPVLINLLKIRATSVLHLLSDVFLSRTRRLNYDLLYSHPDWRYRVRDTYIYSLLKKKALDLGALKPHLEYANRMGTTLWFSDEQKRSGMLNSLIITGQATLCRSLIEYLEELEKPGRKSADPEAGPSPSFLDHFSHDQQLLQNIAALKEQLKNDWEKFTTTPGWLLQAFNGGQ